MICDERKIIFIMFFILIFGFLIKTSYAEGGLSLSQTRVIFDEKMQSVKVIISNKSDQVYLINSRVLLSPDNQDELKQKMPFIMTPPLFRLEKNSQNSILISRNDTSKLPKDRESVYYLSFLAIPSVKKMDSEEDYQNITATQVSFGIRTLIKLFYRPSSLDVPVLVAQGKLIFKQDGNKLNVTNPTPYYLTFAELNVNGYIVDVRKQGSMIAPFSTQYYTIPVTAKEISWVLINDVGGISKRFTWTEKK